MIIYLCGKVTKCSHEESKSICIAVKELTIHIANYFLPVCIIVGVI